MACLTTNHNRGKTYSSLKNGFPVSADAKDTLSLLIVKGTDRTIIYAGTRNGLFYCKEGDYQWSKIPFINNSIGDSGIIDLVKTDDRIIAFGSKSCYRLDESGETPVLKPVNIKIDVPSLTVAPLYRLLFHIHDGSFFGLPGRLFM